MEAGINVDHHPSEPSSPVAENRRRIPKSMLKMDRVKAHPRPAALTRSIFNNLRAPMRRRLSFAVVLCTFCRPPTAKVGGETPATSGASPPLTLYGLLMEG